MPLVSSSSNIPIWVISTNSRTRMNKFNRCKSLETLSKRLSVIESRPSDRIDNKGKLQYLKQSHKRHKIARNQQKRAEYNKIQRENLLMFIRLEYARYGPDKYYAPGKLDQRIKDLYKFKERIRKTEKQQFQQKCARENKELYERINSLEPSYYLDRRHLSQSFQSNKKVKKVMVSAKARLRVDSFQIKKQMDREQHKMSLKYKDMAKQMELHRLKNNTVRRIIKPKLQTDNRSHKKRRYSPRAGSKSKSRVPPRPQSAKVGVTRNNVLIPKMALKKNLQQRPKTAVPHTAKKAVYVDQSNMNNDSHNYLYTNRSRYSMPSMVSIISAPQSTVRKHVNQLSITHTQEHHDENSLSYYLN